LHAAPPLASMLSAAPRTPGAGTHCRAPSRLPHPGWSLPGTLPGARTIRTCMMQRVDHGMHAGCMRLGVMLCAARSCNCRQQPRHGIIMSLVYPGALTAPCRACGRKHACSGRFQPQSACSHRTRSSRSRAYAVLSCPNGPRYGSGFSACRICAVPMSCRQVLWPQVGIVPKLTPWYAFRRATTSMFPEYTRAMSRARSFASLPEFTK
jgi:hypothetical protein